MFQQQNKQNRRVSLNRGVSLNPAHWKIGSKIVGIVLVVVLLSVTSLTAFSYRNFSTSTIETLGHELVDYGHEALLRSADIVAGSVGALEALATFEQHTGRIALVLSDAAMPEMGGQALFYALRELDPTVKVVMLSGHVIGQDIENLRAQGLAGWPSPLAWSNWPRCWHRRWETAHKEPK